MEQLKSLARVSDGKVSPLYGDAAYNFVLFLPWGGLWLGLRFIPGGTLALFLTAAVAVAGWLAFARVPDATATSAPGVWLTGRKALWGRRIERAAPLAGLGMSVLLTLTAGLVGASTWAMSYLLALTAAFAVQGGYLFWRGRVSLALQVELRVDAEGLYSRRLDGILAWDQIERIEPRERGDRQVLRLAVGPNQAKALPAAQRERGGSIQIVLGDAAVSREDVVAAMIAARPSLAGTEPAQDPAMVQPITGASIDDSPSDDVTVAVLAGVVIAGTLS